MTRLSRRWRTGPALIGSFSAEHGVGLSKLKTMARRKDPVALDVMRAVRAALDPMGLMNPGKGIPGVGKEVPIFER